MKEEDNLFVITPHQLNLNDIYSLVDSPSNGAIVVMSGMVRNNTKGKGVLCLDYEAYTPMALAFFRQISRECKQKFTIDWVAIHHRIGRLTIGEVSVLVAVSAAHRRDAFAGCQYSIDRVKQEAPIWKKENWLEGGSTWVD